MKILYIVPCLNEENVIDYFFTEICKFKQDCDVSVLFVDNGSVDKTYLKAQSLREKHNWIFAVSTKTKGLGAAFNLGLLKARALFTSHDPVWIVFAAVDLPFGFTDINYLIRNKLLASDSFYVGSKSHKESIIARTYLRRFATSFFYFLRKQILSLEIKDTQGSLIFKLSTIHQLAELKCINHLYSVELLYKISSKVNVVEIPVNLKAEIRPSRFNVIKELLTTVKGLIWIRKNVKKI